jgi:hypothetical protein
MNEVVAGDSFKLDASFTVTSPGIIGTTTAASFFLS